MTIVPFTNLKLTFELHQEEYEGAILETLRAGWYVLGSQLSELKVNSPIFLEKNTV